MVTGLWLERLRVDGMAWEPATYYPTPRGRRNERLRPQLADLLPFADRIRQASSLGAEVWADLAGHTEAAWGDSHGQGVHFSADSARYLWLDRARQA